MITFKCQFKVPLGLNYVPLEHLTLLRHGTYCD